MKRTPKEKNRASPNTDLASVAPWAAWFWLANWSHPKSINRDFPNDSHELDWVRRQLHRVIEVIQLDRESASSKGYEKGESTSEPSNSMRPTWSSVNPPTPPSLVVLASSSRSDRIEEAMDDLGKRYPQAKIRFVLGEWWSGHRRTWQFSSDVPKVYWHQCHDVLLPEAMELLSSSIELPTQIRQALVVSDDSSMRHMWLEALPSLGFQVLAARDVDYLPEGMVDLVLLDQDRSKEHQADGSPEDIDEALHYVASKVTIVRRAFPQARIVVCSGFPRWIEMHRCIEAGADLFLGKPFDLGGFGRILRAKVESLF